MIGAVEIDLMEDTEINRTETIKNAKRFLGKQLPNCLHRSGKSRLNLSAVAFDPTGVTSHGVNHQEEKAIISLNDQKIVLAATHTINNLSNSPRKPFKQLLALKYNEELYDWQIYSKFHYSKAQYYRLLSNALIEFAQLMDYYCKEDKAGLEKITKYQENKMRLN